MSELPEEILRREALMHELVAVAEYQPMRDHEDDLVSPTTALRQAWAGFALRILRSGGRVSGHVEVWRDAAWRSVWRFEGAEARVYTSPPVDLAIQGGPPIGDASVRVRFRVRDHSACFAVLSLQTHASGSPASSARGKEGVGSEVAAPSSEPAPSHGGPA